MRDSTYEIIINTTSRVKKALNTPRTVTNQASKVAKSVVNSLDVSKNDAKAKIKYDIQQECEQQIKQDAKESTMNAVEDAIDRVENNPMQGVDEGGARRDKEELGKQLEASNLVLSKDPEKVNKMLTFFSKKPRIPASSLYPRFPNERNILYDKDIMPRRRRVKRGRQLS